MLQAKASLLLSDIRGIEKILSAYGDMGSFNDICLSRVTRKNENFSELQSQAWQLATDIRRDNKASTGEVVVR